MLTEKYSSLSALASKLGVRNFSLKEEAGKLHVGGTTTYQLEKDLFWDAIKKHAGWEAEVSANIEAERTDIHGIHVVQPGDTLSKIAKVHLDDATRYTEIFKVNSDKLKDPNLIHPGQELVIPKR
jgi:LysM repeat protein